MGTILPPTNQSRRHLIMTPPTTRDLAAAAMVVVILGLALIRSLRRPRARSVDPITSERILPREKIRIGLREHAILIFQNAPFNS